MHKGCCPGGEADGEATCPAACQDLRRESYTQGTEHRAGTLHDKAHTERDHGHTHAAVRRTSERTLVHRKDSGEAWATRVLAPGGATDLMHKGSLYHTLDKHMRAGGTVSASGFACAV